SCSGRLSRNRCAIWLIRSSGDIAAGHFRLALVRARTSRPAEPGRPGGKRMLQGLIMDMPLMISSAIQHAAEFHGGTEIVARDVDGTIHRYTYAEAHRRTKRLANALGRLGVRP